VTATNVSSAGLYVQPLVDTIADIQAAVQGVYGADVNVSLATPDGQLIKAFATAIFNQATLLQQVYNTIDVRNATGAGLRGRVRLNGLIGSAGTQAVVTLQCDGTVGTVLPVGLALLVDNAITWTLTAQITITSSGHVTGTFQAAVVGAYTITSGSSLAIATPIYGLQTVRAPSTPITVLTPGTAYEQDPALQVRRSQSVATPAKSIQAAMLAQVLGVSGCQQAVVYENKGDFAVSYGSTPVAGHSVLVVAYPGLGGVTTPFDQAVANAITITKAPGCGTAGARAVTLTDAAGINYTVNYSLPTQTDLTFTVTVKTLQGWTDAVGKPAVQQAIVSAVNTGLFDANGKQTLAPVTIGGAVAPVAIGGAVTTVPYCRLDAISVTLHSLTISSGEEPLALDEIAVCSALANVTVVTV